MNIPADLRYTSNHEWLRVEGDIATVGITDFAQSQLGDIIYVDVPSVGSTLARGDSFGSVEAVKTVADIFMPVDGQIVELNSDVDAQPELVNREPYAGGWIIKVRISDPDQLGSLLPAEEYSKII
ncbi:MAG: glycine cleavage system protein GcvH [Rikenellaceae bacterium]|jgi:glycine cleavage system H protein|nr:glycine cleavage system protein GcvH [Rikenellaceae bacterium]